MQRVLSIALAFCLALTVSLDANAKRFGGGKSLGSAPSHQTRQAQPATAPNATAAAPNAARPAAAASGASRWLGPLAGIAAGGLLASMFMGDGFEGIQMLDILLIALVAFIAFRFIAARRRQQNQGQPAMAGHAPMQREMPAQAPIFGGAAAAAAAPSPVINAPSWFNEERFVGAAREHFMSLQQHWDANEMDKIAEFVTPQMLQWLKQERAEIGDAYQFHLHRQPGRATGRRRRPGRQDNRHPDLQRCVEDLALRPGRSLQRKLADGARPGREPAMAGGRYPAELIPSGCGPFGGRRNPRFRQGTGVFSSPLAG